MLIAATGAFPQVKMHDPVPLIAERFFPGSGWMELFILALYGGWLIEKLLTARCTGRLRRNIRLAFSIIFFLQALLGISGFSKFLMTGSLHLPVPSMIIAGPVYRGACSLFMPLLLSITLLLAGSAWCSWFCYFGSWDFAASRVAGTPGAPVKHPFFIRIVVLTALVTIALLLRFAGLR